MEKLCQKIKNKDRGCLPVKNNDSYSAYELKECFPCLDTPISHFFVDRFPFVQWLSKYSFSTFVSDLIAGLTVGLMVVPQALAYASIAQLPLQVCIKKSKAVNIVFLRTQYGLYSAFMGCFVYTIFGTSKDVTLGPTAIMSLLTASKATNVNNPVDINVRNAIALTLLSGLVQFLMGMLNLGDHFCVVVDVCQLCLVWCDPGDVADHDQMEA